MLKLKIKTMESLRIPEVLRQLSEDEQNKTYGGTAGPDLIFFPVALGNMLGTCAAPFLADLYLKNSLFLNF